MNTIKDRLIALRKSRAPLTVVTVRGIMLATIIHMNPGILKMSFKDGSKFRASDTFVRGWLHSALDWSWRKATRSAHKLPENWEEQCEKSTFRKAYTIKEHDIPAELYVNSDQTQLVYAPGDKMTWAERGANQVTLTGTDEKRAFTLKVSVASDGTLLPFQAVYLVFAGSVRSGLLTLRSMDRDLDRSTATIKGKKTELNQPRPQFSVHGPVLTSPGLNWFKTGLDRFFYY